MNKIEAAIAFLLGAAVGGTAVWYLVKDKYAKIAEDEINSVKETYARHERAQNALNRYKGLCDDEKKSDISNNSDSDKVSVPDNGNAAKHSDNTKTKESRIDYSNPATTENSPVENKSEIPPTGTPYVITPDEFDERYDDGYNAVTYIYFSDGVVSDEYGVVVDNVEEMFGDALEHIGEYEDDSVYVRNDLKKCDYEIFTDLRSYAQFRRTLPNNI